MRRSVHLLLAATVVAGCRDATGPEPDPGLDIVLEAWPVEGAEGVDWVINNYVDLDPGPGLADYRGGAKVYDGHRGVDIDVPNFRWMDADHGVLAVAAGEVVRADDGEPDRNVSCVGDWNEVRVRHSDGSVAIYGHLKRNSVVVSVGEQVAAGDLLGVVGSSGCSTQPHLHLELLDADGDVVDPFLSGLWADPPPYDTPLEFMDLLLKDGSITGVDELKDPPANATVVTVGGVLGVGLSMSGGVSGDVIEVEVLDGGGASIDSGHVTFDRTWRHTYWFWNLEIVGGVQAGDWTVTVRTNGTLKVSAPITGAAPAR